MSHPHPHLDNVPHDVVYNAMPLCIIHSSFPSIKLTTRNFSLNIDGKKIIRQQKEYRCNFVKLMRRKLMH